jgi:hypothetical protein
MFLRRRKKTGDSGPEPEPVWQDGAGSLLLLAAAHETGLISAFQMALPTAAPTTRFGRMGHAVLRALLLTLRFLPVAGLRRTWDLRSYTGDTLALLTGRGWAYGYRHVEHFLAGSPVPVPPLASPMRWPAGRRSSGIPPPRNRPPLPTIILMGTASRSMPMIAFPVG